MNEVRREELQRMSENELNIIWLSFSYFCNYNDYDIEEIIIENDEDDDYIEEIRELNWIQLIFHFGIKYLTYNRDEIINSIKFNNRVEKKIKLQKMSKFELNKLLVEIFISNKDKIIDDILEWEEIHFHLENDDIEWDDDDIIDDEDEDEGFFED